jgi:hypothetical protein
MQFRKIGLPVIVASMMGFVFMGPQQAPSQSPATPSSDPLVVQTVPVQENSAYGIYSQRTNDPKLVELQNQEAQADREVNSLLASYGRTDKEGDRAAIKKKLTANLEKLFDAQQKRREMEVTRIEDQLKKLREVIEKRAKGKDKIIDRRLEQLLQDAEGLGWSSPHGFSFYRSDYLIPSNTPLPDAVPRP